MAEELTGIIGGSGLGESLAEQIREGKERNVTTPFGRPSESILVGTIGKSRIAFLNRHGRGHKLSPSEAPYAANIYALKKIGCRSVLATCAVGSLNGAIRPGEVVIVDQFIDKTFRRQSSFFNGYGAVHCEMSEPVCGRLSGVIASAAKGMRFRTHGKGTYVCMEGPQFSTRAESLMHRKWGGDLIGMTAMPEAKLAREAQMCYALIAIVSDYDCWRPAKKGVGKQELLREIIGNMKRASDNCISLIEKILQGSKAIASEKCGCRRSLELAVWTDMKMITASQQRKVAVLFE
jgi:5'-methylthioadenosine phosphorylase